MEKYTRLLTIAGSDSGGGAGIQADIKTFSALGCYGMSVITAVTAQNTCRVSAIHEVPPEVIEAQLRAVLSDIGVDAIKIGMLPSPQGAERIAKVLEEHISRIGKIALVVDTVMVATSGDRLIAEATADILRNRLIPMASMITPNLPEAEFLLGTKISRENMVEAIHTLLSLRCESVVLKGGHLEGDEIVDFYLEKGWESPREFPCAKIKTQNTHGTGCTLSSAIASFLGRGFSQWESVEKGIAYTRKAVAQGARYKTGKGNGPINHSFI